MKLVVAEECFRSGFREDLLNKVVGSGFGMVLINWLHIWWIDLCSESSDGGLDYLCHNGKTLKEKEIV